MTLTTRLLVKLCLFTGIFVIGTQMVSAQFNVGGVTVPKVKRGEKPKSDPPATNQPTSSDTGTKGGANDNSATKSNSSPKKQETDVRISLFLDDIKKAQNEVDIYDPKERLYLTARTQDNYLLMSISKKYRQEFLTKWSSAAGVEQLNPALDGLGASAAKKLPGYIPNATSFTVHSPVEEKLLKSALPNIATLKIVKIGVKEPSWLIDKNDVGIPTARFKHGAVWARDTSDDHPYCHVYWVNIIQDYAGGGTYGASHAELEYDELYGCGGQ